MIRISLIAAASVLISYGNASAACPQGSAVRIAAKTSFDRMLDGTGDHITRTEHRNRAIAYSILTWDSYGKSGLLGDSVMFWSLRYCYQEGRDDCGMAKNEEIADLLVKQTAARNFQSFPASVPERPPGSAVQWARTTIGGDCALATTQQVAGQSIDQIRPAPSGAPLTTYSNRADATQGPSQAERQAERQANYIADLVSAGDIDTLISPSIIGSVTDAQFGRAVSNRISARRNVQDFRPEYGLEAIPADTLKILRPYIASYNRDYFDAAIYAVRAKQMAAQADQQEAAALARMRRNFANAARNTGSGPAVNPTALSPAQQAQRDAYLRGKANRDACTTANPCGPGNEFVYYPD